MNESFVTKAGSAGRHFVRGPLRLHVSGGHLQAGGVSPLSLLTFFAAAKKVSAAPHSNALNLSPTASSEFVREMEVGLGFSGWPWIGA